MLLTLLKYTRNFFPGERLEGNIEVNGGTVNLPFTGKYALIEGSTFNDGIYEIPLKNLKNETFNGCITQVNPPDEFLKLVKEIEDYNSKNQKPAWNSESFGGYSRSGYISWKEYFKDSLKVWCKL